jgi:hypothetical protein
VDAGARVIVLLAAAAWGQDSPPPPEAPADDTDAPQTSEEIVVYGRLAVQKARDEIVHEMERLGYTVRSRKEGRTIFAPPSDWMGAAILEPDGTFTFRSPVMSPATVPEESYTLDPRYERYEDPTAGQIKASEVQPEVGAGGGASFPSKRKRDLVRAQVIEETSDEVARYRAILEKTRQQEGAPLDPPP